MTTASGNDRRSALRKKVLEKFHVFLVLSSAGSSKHYLKDLSEKGLSFLTDAPGQFKVGQEIDCHFYINPTLKFPLRLRAVHITGETQSAQLIGCELEEEQNPALPTFQAFLRLLDELSGFLD